MHACVMIASGSININMYEFSVKISEKLKLDVLLSNADKVQHHSRRSTEWKDVWKRGHGVQNDQLNDRDGNLIINNFTASDAGIYRVLDSEGELLITVTVEGERNSKSKQPNHDFCQLDLLKFKFYVLHNCSFYT
uniref:Immunoglobulin V-set domain-containing protein n=1 Tax=Sinocyclocheilus rhinocerous TaxID=307959 RepID=A0A673I348_9TELE